MNKIAVIDIGSNSVRLMLLADGKVLYKILNTTQLGEGLAHSDFLKAEAIERTAKAIASFYQQAILEGASCVCAFATAAARSAKNSADFTSRVKELCGLEIEILSGEEEAEIGILGALGSQDGGIIDIGGASTEIIVREKGQIVYKKSVDIGVVRLKDMCGREYSKLSESATNAVEAFGVVPRGQRMLAIGGTATTLAALALQLSKYDASKVTGFIMSAEQVENMSKTLCGMSVEEIMKNPCVPQKRAEVVAGGAVLLAAIMRRLGFEMVQVSDSDNLEGYAKLRGYINE